MISIITINYNNLSGLIKTVNSVKSQISKSYEHIIIDGGSIDGSFDYILANKSLFSNWVSERDSGIYDAMNKGILFSKGTHVLFLNSGDTLYDDNILSSIDFELYSDNLIFGCSISSLLKKYPSNGISKRWLYFYLPNHQAMFFPKRFYEKNIFETSFKIVGDSEYKFRAFEECKYIFLDLIICNFDINGVSNNYNSFNNLILIIKESIKAAYKYRKIDYLLFKILTHFAKYVKCNL